MAEGLGEVVLGISVDADQANAGLDRFKDRAVRAAQEATEALRKVGSGSGATITPKVDSSLIEEFAKRLSGLESGIKAPKVDLSAIKEAIAEAQELRSKIQEINGIKAKATAEFLVTGLDAGTVADSLQNIQRALRAVGTTQVSVSIDSEDFKQATQDAVKLEQKLQQVEKRKAVITADFIVRGLQEGTIDQSIANVQRALQQLNTAQVTVDVDSSDFVTLGQQIAAEEQRLQKLQAQQTRIKVQYIVEGLNDGQVTQSIQNLRQALQGLGTVQASVDVKSDDFIQISRDIAQVEQQLDRVDGRSAVIAADFIVNGLNDGTLSQSIRNARTALENLGNAQVVVDVDSSEFTSLGQAIVREEQRLKQLENKQTIVRVQYLIEGLNNGNVNRSIDNIRQALQGLSSVQASVDVDSSDFVQATEQATRLERQLSDIDGRQAQISASFTVRGLDDGTITQSIANVRSALQGLANAQVAVRVDSSDFEELGAKVAAEEQRLQRLESRQTEVRVRYLVEGLNDGRVTQSLQNIRGLVQNLDNLRATIDVNSPQLPALIRQLELAKQKADQLDAKSINVETGSFRQGLQSGTIAPNTANYERFIGLLKEQQRLVPVGSQAFGQLADEIQRYEGVLGSAAGSVGTFRSALTGLAASFGAFAAFDIGRRIAEAGLNAESAAVRLRALTRQFNEFGPAQEVAANASKVLGISLTEAQNGISSLYASLRPAGVGLKDIETIFLSFTAAARNSGSTAQEASNAFVQLKQSLSKGFLNGDELRSIGEQAPIVAQAIAETLGVSVGKLRDLGAEGKITSEVILQSLERIKGTQLAQLGEQLDTGRQKLKDLRIVAEEVGKDISSALAPLGNTLLTGLTGTLRFFAGLNTDSTQQEIQKVEGQIKATKDLIVEQTKFGIDTTEAEARVKELENRLNNLKGRQTGSGRISDTQQRIDDLEKVAKKNEELNRNGAFDLSVGNSEFAVRAQAEGLRKALNLFKAFNGQSAPSFDISKEVSALGFELKDAENQIAALSKQKLDIPVEATLEREAIDKSIKEAEARLKNAEIKIGLQLQFEELGKEKGRLEKFIKADPGNQSFQVRLQEVEVARARIYGLLQDANNASDQEANAAAKTAKSYQAIQNNVKAYNGSINDVTASLKAAENAIGEKPVFSFEFDQAINDAARLRQELNEVNGFKAIATAQVIIQGIDQGTFTNSIQNIQQALQELENGQISLDVDSSEFVDVGRRIVETDQRLQKLQERQTIVRVKAVIEGLANGTVRKSLQTIQQQLQDFEQLRARVAIDSPDLPTLTRGLTLAREQLDLVDGRKAKVEVEVIQSGIAFGEITNNLNNLERRIAGLRTLQVTLPIGSAEFDRVASAIRGLQAQQQAATNNIKESTVSVGDALIAGSRKAATILGDTVKGLRSALESGFKFLTAQKQQQVLQSSLADIGQGVQSGIIDPNKAQGAIGQGPESIIQLASTTRSILEAANRFDQALRDQRAANANPNIVPSITRLVTSFEDGVAVIRQISQPGGPQPQKFGPPATSNTAQLEAVYSSLINSNQTLAGQLQSNSQAVAALVNKNWDVNVTVNAANGSTPIAAVVNYS